MLSHFHPFSNFNFLSKNFTATPSAILQETNSWSCHATHGSEYNLEIVSLEVERNRQFCFLHPITSSLNSNLNKRVFRKFLKGRKTLEQVAWEGT